MAVITFRPTIQIVGPPGDARLIKLLLGLVEAARKPVGEEQMRAIDAAQDLLVKAGLPEEEVFEISRLFLAALHPQEVRSRTPLGNLRFEVHTREVKNGVLVVA